MELTEKRRKRLIAAVKAEWNWSQHDQRRVLRALDRVADGPLEVRENYGALDEMSWTDAETVDGALDYFGIDIDYSGIDR